MPVGIDPAEKKRQEQLARDRIEKEITQQQAENSGKYNPRTQPRTNNGRFQRILARLKLSIGDSELEQITNSINEAQQANEAGNYQKSTQAAQAVMTEIAGIKSGAVDDSQRNALRRGAADLGRVLAYLPLPQGVDTAKVRFSDLPPSTRTFIKGLIDQVMQKLPPDKASSITGDINNFLSGEVQFNSDQISAEMNKLLRYLVK
jgi:hypothetical protein